MFTFDKFIDVIIGDVGDFVSFPRKLLLKQKKA